jgi:hypothetical protein
MYRSVAAEKINIKTTNPVNSPVDADAIPLS